VSGVFSFSDRVIHPPSQQGASEMLRVNVGLSRKLSKDFNSTGFSVNIDGEVSAPSSDPEAVMEQVKELFDLAEESLSQQIERTQGEAAIAGRDEEPVAQHGNENGQRSRTNNNSQQRPAAHSGNGNDRRPAPYEEEQPATNKQINYLLNIGKRQKLSTAQLEKRVADILGRQVGLYDLTKQAAAIVIDQLTTGVANGKSSSRN
jgi:hypothetical protein